MIEMASRILSLVLCTAFSGVALVAVLAPAWVDRTKTALLLPPPLTDQDFLYDCVPDPRLVELGRNLFFDPNCFKSTVRRERNWMNERCERLQQALRARRQNPFNAPCCPCFHVSPILI